MIKNFDSEVLTVLKKKQPYFKQCTIYNYSLLCFCFLLSTERLSVQIQRYIYGVFQYLLYLTLMVNYRIVELRIKQNYHIRNSRAYDLLLKK